MTSIENIVREHREECVLQYRRRVEDGDSPEIALRFFCYEGAFGFKYNAKKAFEDARNYLIRHGLQKADVPRVIPHE